MPVNAFCISADKHKLISKIYNRDLILLQPYSRCIQKNQVFLKSKNRGEEKLFAAAVLFQYTFIIYYRRFIRQFEMCRFLFFFLLSACRARRLSFAL